MYNWIDIKDTEIIEIYKQFILKCIDVDLYLDQFEYETEFLNEALKFDTFEEAEKYRKGIEYFEYLYETRELQTSYKII